MFPIGSVLSNKPLEWTGHPHPSASPLQPLCLPLRGSVIRIHKAVNQGPRMVLSGSTMDG